VTVQIARPGGKGGGQARGGGTGDAGGGNPVYVASADGDTIFSAIRNLAQFSSRRIMWAHNNVVVVGESLAREDVTPVIDFFTRNQELRMRTWFAVTRGTSARSIVSATTGIEQIPADSIAALFRYAQLPGEAVKTDVNDVASAFLGGDVEAVVTAVKLNNRALVPSENPASAGKVLQVEVAGSALFRGKRLAGFIDRDAGRGLLWLRRQMRNAVLTIPCPKGHEGNMAVEIRGPKVSVRTQIQKGRPAFAVSVRTAAWIAEQNCSTPELSGADLKHLAEQALSRKIESEIREALRQIQQEQKVDAVKFGRLLHIQQPGWWRVNSQRWAEIFPTVPVTVAVQTDIPKMGLYVRPMHMK
jgi:spore germination protein KC